VQLEQGMSKFLERYPNQYYLAYFQAYTNTYAPLNKLKALYEEALSHPGVIGLVVGTRPDCLPNALISYLKDLQKDYYVVVELGIESTSEESLLHVNRGHTFEETREAVFRLHDAGLPIGGHIILGLPGETSEIMLSHAYNLSQLPLDFLKIHQLQIVRGSLWGEKYLENPEQFRIFETEEYIDLIIPFLERLTPRIVVERLVSQAPSKLLLAPRWGLKNFQFVEIVRKRMIERNTWQGCLYDL
jgi:radical SAM protein (TIGR01212 family)